MKVSNLRYETDPTTFEQNAVVDVKIDRMTLYEMNLLREDIRNDILMTLGQEFFEQVQELQRQRIKNEQRTK